MRRYFFRLFCGFIVILSLVSITFGWSVDRSQVLTSLTWHILEEWHYSPGNSMTSFHRMLLPYTLRA